MKRLLFSLLAMFALVWALDHAIGGGIEKLFHASTNPTDGDVLGQAWTLQPPIVVCGASRASHHYVSDSLAAWTGEGVYNLGRDGSWGPAYQYGCAGILLRHYTPALWIMDVDPFIVRGPELIDRLSCFLPWARSEPVARELVGLRSRYEGLRLLSRIYPFNSLVLRLAAPSLGHETPSRAGFLPLSGRYAVGDADPGAGDALEPVAGIHPSERVPLDSLKLRRLAQTVNHLRSRGVTVLAVRSPRYILSASSAYKDSLDAHELQVVFAHLHVRLLDFSSARTTRYADPALYRDPSHLNEEGALRFSRELADSLGAMGVLQGSPRFPSPPKGDPHATR